MSRQELALEFLKESFREEPVGVAKYCISVVHNAACDLPDLLSHFSHTNPNLIVKTGIMGHSESDIQTKSLAAYYESVQRSYCNGTFRAGPLHPISLVGTAHEEAGGYFPEFLQLLQQNPLLNLSMPWGQLAAVKMSNPQESNDGPILWVRPGEQLVPTADIKAASILSASTVVSHHHHNNNNNTSSSHTTPHKSTSHLPSCPSLISAPSASSSTTASSSTSSSTPCCTCPHLNSSITSSNGSSAHTTTSHNNASSSNGGTGGSGLNNNNGNCNNGNNSSTTGHNHQPSTPTSVKKTDRVNAELRSLYSSSRRVSEPREIMFEDRTRCHADHVGHGLERHTCAAVGILKGVHVGHPNSQNRVTKDVVAFDAAFFHELVEKLQVRSPRLLFPHSVPQFLLLHH